MSQTMLLSRALRYKKILLEKIQQYEADVINNNSKPIESVREVDVNKSFTAYTNLIEYLINFKLIVQKATLPIQKQILQLSESKSYLAFLSKINTTRGKIPGYEQVIEYNTIYCRADIDKMKENIKIIIDTLQTEIDTHNASTLIEIEDLPTV
jgi:hypothetical protein